MATRKADSESQFRPCPVKYVGEAALVHQYRDGNGYIFCIKCGDIKTVRKDTK